MARTAILIGQVETCRQLERQLDLLVERPLIVGWIVTGAQSAQTIADIASPDSSILGSINQLEALTEKHQPELALIALPAVLKDQIRAIRTRLRKLGVPDRFMPTLEDQIAGVGPRTHIDIDPAHLLERPPHCIDSQAVQHVIQGKIVLITGAGGSIGSELSRIAANDNPKRLLLMDRSENALFEIDRQIARTHPELPRKAILHDVVDAAGTRRHFRNHGIQVIFHAAAHKHVPMMENHPAQAVENNLFGTKAVVDASHEFGAERFVMISTDKAVNPSSIMGATKRLAELYVQHVNQDSSTKFSIVRFGNVLGSSGSVLETWSKQIADGGSITVTDPRMTRYFMTIPEAASLVIQSASLVDADVKQGEVFLLDMGEPVNILDMARRFIVSHGLHPVLPGDERPADTVGTATIVITGVRPGEKLHESLAFDAEAMRPTRHPDINIWRLQPPDRRYMENVMERLESGIRPEKPDEVADLIRQFLPEMTPSFAA